MPTLFDPVFTGSFTAAQYLLCTGAALILGLLIAFTACHRTPCTKSYLLTLLLLPTVVQTVIMLVNGSVGTGLAVAGSFSLVRFRSAPGSAREILLVFLTVAVGLATATGYLAMAVLVTCIVCLVVVLSAHIRLPEDQSQCRDLRITVPESLNYAHAFDSLFQSYTKSYQLINARTTNMGSLYRLHYRVFLKDLEQEQAFIDALRCRNGNLEISLGIAEDTREAL